MKTGQRKLKMWFDPRGFIKKVVNPTGTKPAVYISEAAIHPGWTAFIKKRPYNKPKELGHSMDAEMLMKRFVRKGHKSVEFWD